jgi:hypothetical protein
MLTINAHDHPLMNQFFKPVAERRLVAIKAADRRQKCLRAKTDIMGFMLPFDAELLHAVVPHPFNSSLV